MPGGGREAASACGKKKRFREAGGSPGEHRAEAAGGAWGSLASHGGLSVIWDGGEQNGNLSPMLGTVASCTQVSPV